MPRKPFKPNGTPNFRGGRPDGRISKNVRAETAHVLHELGQRAQETAPTQPPPSETSTRFSWGKPSPPP